MPIAWGSFKLALPAHSLPTVRYAFDPAERTITNPRMPRPSPGGRRSVKGGFGRTVLRIWEGKTRCMDVGNRRTFCGGDRNGSHEPIRIRATSGLSSPPPTPLDLRLERSLMSKTKTSVLRPDLISFIKEQPAFEAWLTERGSEILAPSNTYEVARFRTDSGVGVIYKNSSGRLTSFVNGADKAYRAFKFNETWRAMPKPKRKMGTRIRHLTATLIERDGLPCFYCGQDTSDENRSIEHLLSVTHGGPDHLANLALSHVECNRAVGHLSVKEKLELVIRSRTSK